MSFFASSFLTGTTWRMHRNFHGIRFTRNYFLSSKSHVSKNCSGGCRCINSAATRPFTAPFSPQSSSISSPTALSTVTATRGEKVESEDSDYATDQSWSEEWKKLGLGVRLPRPGSTMTTLLFVQTGFGVDQHGDRSRHGATKAAVRAVRNAIEFNSIPGAITAIPGGRTEMLIQVRLGVPPRSYVSGFSSSKHDPNDDRGAEPPMDVDLSDVAKVFPYGRLLPIDVVVGGLSFPTGRIVHELGDEDDVAICCAACVSIGYDDGSVHDPSNPSKSRGRNSGSAPTHETYSTKDGY